MPRMLLRLFVFTAGIIVLAPASWARGQLVCDEAASWAAKETGVPLVVLQALTRAETGRIETGDPWPWTVNLAGKGYWFASESEAQQFAGAQIDGGATNIDIGCFQLNYHWHSKAFLSVEAMFNPLANARYAAGFLSEKYNATGKWPAAAGAYHSGKPDLADTYALRFSAILASLEAAGDAGFGSQAQQAGPYRARRVNSFPLLMAGQPGGQGSLVPRTDGTGALFAQIP